MNRVFLRQVWLCCRMQYRKWGESPKIPVFAGLTVLMIHFQLRDLNGYEQAHGLRCTVWIIPYLFFPLMLLAVSLLVTALFSGAPFYDPHAVFVLSKTGRKPWFCGMVLYLFLTSGLFAVFLAVLPFLLGLPYLDYGLTLRSWYYSRVAAFSLPEAECIGICLVWMVSFWLGALILFCNVVIRPGSGIAVAAFFGFFSYLINIYPPFARVGYLSPVSWMDVRFLNWSGGSGRHPGVLYVTLFLLGTSAAMLTAAWLRFRTSELSIGKRGAQ